MNPDPNNWNIANGSEANLKMKGASKKKTKASAAATAAAAGSEATYKDFMSLEDDDQELSDLLSKTDAEGVKGTDQTFPVKLHQLLSSSDEDGFSHIVSWQPHGRSFIVKKHKEFVEKVLPYCFRQSKFASFQRQLNLYGFRRITHGRDKGGYYHELFLRGRTLLALKMQRTKVKGTGARKPSVPESEPDFSKFPVCYEKNTNSPAVAAAAAAASRDQSASGAGMGFVTARARSGEANNHVSPRFAASAPGTGTGMISSYPFLHGSLGGGGGASFPSLFGTAGLPDDDARRRAIMAEMIAASSRLQNFRAAQASKYNHNFGSSSLLYGALLQSNGSLHFDGSNRPCDCPNPKI